MAKGIDIQDLEDKDFRWLIQKFIEKNENYLMILNGSVKLLPFTDLDSGLDKFINNDDF